MHEYYDYLQEDPQGRMPPNLSRRRWRTTSISSPRRKIISITLPTGREWRSTGTHGLFSSEGEPVVLSRVAEEVANHPGVVWTNVISLRREDAERLRL